MQDGPGLDVLGVGPLSMPMQPGLSDLLQTLCQGTEQAVNEDQGGVWHLDAALLAATNPGKPVQQSYFFLRHSEACLPSYKQLTACRLGHCCSQPCS